MNNPAEITDLFNTAIYPTIDQSKVEVTGYVNDSEWLKVAYCAHTMVGFWQAVEEMAEGLLSKREIQEANSEAVSNGKFWMPEFQKRALEGARDRIMMQLLGEIEKVLGEQ